jgi:hypothetical protein
MGVQVGECVYMARKLPTILGRWEARDRGRDLEKVSGVGEDTILREFIKYLYIISLPHLLHFISEY